ncbi:MAG: PfkB family carbohydrate kinase [Deltaproteobacteria bacterium]
MNTVNPKKVDVLCVGQASYDLIFAVERQPGGNEKIAAIDYTNCGGGPAANAAVTVARLGGKAAFAGYLDLDLYGESHHRELRQEGVLCDYIVRGERPTPLSAIIVKPDGARTVVNHRIKSVPLRPEELDLHTLTCKFMLFDGHEPLLGEYLAGLARGEKIPTMLDAGSFHAGTEKLAPLVDYLVCSEPFAQQYSGRNNLQEALVSLAGLAPYIVITCGERGLLWKTPAARGTMDAFAVTAVDTTGAGDVFHGALAIALARKTEWQRALRYASATAALCCTKLGARPGIPTKAEVEAFLTARPNLPQEKALKE